MSIAIKLTGLDGMMIAINKTIAQAEKGTHTALVTFAKGVETDAKNTLQRGGGKYGPTSNTGQLAGSITGSVKGLTATIVASAGHAAYIEFGTRKFAARYVATLPQDWKTYAATFKGKGGGTFSEFIDDLIQWIKAKGIDVVNFQREQQYDAESGNTIVPRKRRVSKDKKNQMTESAAYAIALHILREGIRPQPFLYPAVVKHTPKLIADIKKVFE